MGYLQYQVEMISVLSNDVKTSTDIFTASSDLTLTDISNSFKHLQLKQHFHCFHLNWHLQLHSWFTLDILISFRVYSSTDTSNPFGV